MLQPTELPAKAPFSAKKAKWRRLTSIADVRMAMASVIRRVYDEEMGEQRGQTCISGLRSLGEILKQQNLAAYSEETLIAELRQRLGTRLAAESTGDSEEAGPGPS